MVTSLSACSSDDNTNNESRNIIGTWGTKWNDGTGVNVHPKFTFLNNGKVKYYTYSNSTQPQLEEIGDWNMIKNTLTMRFSQGSDSTFKNRIIFITDSQIDFENIDHPDHSTRGAESYFKSIDPNLD